MTSGGEGRVVLAVGETVKAAMRKPAGNTTTQFTGANTTGEAYHE
jgi:hypothetical protein